MRYYNHINIRSIYRTAVVLVAIILVGGCQKSFLELEPRGTQLETNFYKTQDDLYQALIATYDVLQWGGTNGWTMQVGLLNAASDDCFAGGSDASDQPSWVAYDQFTLDPFLGPQSGLWAKGFTGIYRANLLLEKLEEVEDLTPEFKARTAAEAKFLRAFFYFDLVRFFENVPLITKVLSPDEIYSQTQVGPEEIYAQIESDLNDARNTFELPTTVASADIGRVTQGAVAALLGKVILYQNDNSRMLEAAELFDEVINSPLYELEDDFGDIFKTENEFGSESVFEIQHSGNHRGGWANFANGTEGNYNVQFFGMRDYVGPTFASGWSFCPVTPDLVDFMRNDPRFEHTIIDGNLLKLQGATYTEGFQNTDYFIRKYAGLADERALDGEPALNWSTNIREIRLADVYLMAAEAYVRGGEDATGRNRLNFVRRRVSLQPVGAVGQILLDAIYNERRLELATEGHRFFDLVRIGRAADVLDGFMSGKHERLPIPQTEIDITEGTLVQNPMY